MCYPLLAVPVGRKMAALTVLNDEDTVTAAGGAGDSLGIDESQTATLIFDPGEAPSDLTRRLGPNRAARSSFLSRRRGVLAALVMLFSLVGPAVASAAEHEVGEGETLSQIAVSYGVTVDDITRINDLDDPDSIRAGDILLIPDPPYDGPTLSYEVASGDTLSEIADRYDVDVDDLLSLNGLDDPNRVKVGQELLIPDPQAAEDTTERPYGFDAIHTVDEDDVLGLIAEEYGVTMSSIMRANGITDPNLVQLGDELVIPDVMPRTEEEQIEAYFEYWDAEYGIPTEIHKAIGWQESRWQADALSYAGAMGIGQLMPYTVDFVADDLLGETGLDPWDPEDNIKMSARLLAFLLEETDGDMRMSIGAYYQGLGSIRQKGYYGETETYIAGVLGFVPLFEAEE